MSWLEYGLLHLNNVKPGLKIELRREATCLCCPHAHIHTRTDIQVFTNTISWQATQSCRQRLTKLRSFHVRLLCTWEKFSIKGNSHTLTHTLPVSYCHLEAEENNKASGYGPARHKDNGYSMCDSHAHTHNLPWVRLRKENSLIIAA